MRTGWILGVCVLVVVAYVGCGSDEDTTIDGNTGGATSGTGGNLSVGVQVEGTRTIEGMDDCPPCEPGQGCLAAAISRTDDDSELPWVQSPDEADGVGPVRVTETTADESWQQTAAGIDLQADAGPHVVGVCVPAGQGTLTAFLDDNENAEETASTSTDPIDACAQNRFVSVQVPADKTLWVPYELATSCE